MNQILFTDFCQLLHKISLIDPVPVTVPPANRPDPPKATRKIRAWIARLRQEEDLHPETGPIFFRLLFPEEDVSRKYGLKETRLARQLVDEFNVHVEHRGRPLVEWDEWTRSSSSAKVGCLGSEVVKVLEPIYTTHNPEQLTLNRADELLTELARHCIFSDIPKVPMAWRPQKAIIHDLYCHLSPIEAGFMTQIILKDLKPILHPLTVLNTPEALKKYNTNSVHILTSIEVMREWDPEMIRIYHVRARLDEAARTVWQIRSGQPSPQDQAKLFAPKLGTPIEIPKSAKGRSCAHVYQTFRKSMKVMAETKYDGERMQVHVDLSQLPGQQIQIFSKSRIESTKDRVATHPMIRAALNLPHMGNSLPHPALQTRNGTRPKISDSVILDCEMVAYSETRNCIDEFWRIRSLIETTSHGARGKAFRRPRKMAYEEHDVIDSSIDSSGAPHIEDDIEESSLQSNASDDGQRHLMLVFFDVLFLEGKSLLSEPYSYRREVLESLVTVIPGFTRLAEVFQIETAPGSTLAVQQIQAVFAECMADYQEGLVFKAAESRYNDFSLPWVKLKRDYIPGLGDCVDIVVIGAAWDKARGRDLRVGPSTFTTFYLGFIDNTTAAKPGPKRREHFECFFTVSWGLTREQLEELNFLINASSTVPNNAKGTAVLSYSFNLLPGLSLPDVLLSEPMLFEVFGAGFDKARGSKYYELRWPRISKVWRSNERAWTQGTKLKEFQDIAHRCVGRESNDRQIDNIVDNIWGIKPATPLKCPLKRRRTVQQFQKQLQGSEQPPLKQRKIERSALSDVVLRPLTTNHEYSATTAPKTPLRKTRFNSPPSASPTRHNPAVYRVESLPADFNQRSPSVVGEACRFVAGFWRATAPSPCSFPLQERIGMAATQIDWEESPRPPLLPSFTLPSLLSPISNYIRGTPTLSQQARSGSVASHYSPYSSKSRHCPTQLHAPLSPSRSQTISALPSALTSDFRSLEVLLEDAFVHVVRSSSSARRHAKTLSRSKLLHTLDALLVVVGWKTSTPSPIASRGLVFVELAQAKGVVEQLKDAYIAVRDLGKDFKQVIVLPVQLLSEPGESLTVLWDSFEQ